MSSHDDCVFEVLGVLAAIHNAFIGVSASIGNHPAITRVSTSVLPVKSRAPTDYADEGIIVSVAINANLVNPKDRDKAALGASILLRRPLGVWVAEAEVGWTGASIGWDSFDSREGQAEQFAQLTPQLPALVDWVLARFQEELAKLS
jgi:hypothetical protein